MQGRYFWNKRSAEGLTKAAAFFQQAIHLDGRYALAYVGLADATQLVAEYGWGTPVVEALPRARAAANKALELDPGLAEAHASLCGLHMYDYEWRMAERECSRAVELKPGYATAHHWRSIVLSAMGRNPEAVAEARLAQQFDPVSAVFSNVVTLQLYLARDYDAALDQGRRTVELDPALASGHLVLAMVYLQLKRPGDAIAELEPVAGRAPKLR